MRWKAHGWESFKHLRRSPPGPEDKLWCLQEQYVPGSLVEFGKFTVLTFKVEGLSGEEGENGLVEMLPKALVELNLLASVSNMGRSMEQIWKQLLSLAGGVENTMPQLKKVGLVVVGHENKQEDGDDFAELKNAFSETGVAFEKRPEDTIGDEGWMADKKWFLDQVPSSEDLPY